ncbi:MAG: hypothetical protein J07HQX50_01151 [Haloquadratum sp. J07HQX50]|nr:MAG: hypothetical protein J07HQX50_01151 [Haloquadratum sp. J07HQX50]
MAGLLRADAEQKQEERADKGSTITENQIVGENPVVSPERMLLSTIYE